MPGRYRAAAVARCRPSACWTGQTRHAACRAGRGGVRCGQRVTNCAASLLLSRRWAPPRHRFNPSCYVPPGFGAAAWPSRRAAKTACLGMPFPSLPFAAHSLLPLRVCQGVRKGAAAGLAYLPAVRCCRAATLAQHHSGSGGTLGSSTGFRGTRPLFGGGRRGTCAGRWQARRSAVTFAVPCAKLTWLRTPFICGCVYASTRAVLHCRQLYFIRAALYAQRLSLFAVTLFVRSETANWITL